MLEQTIDGLSLLAGVALGSASLVSLGPTNMMLIREGLKQGHVATVSGFVFALDIVLISSGLGFSTLWSEFAGPSQSILTWAGVVVLAYFGVRSISDCVTRSGAAKLNIDGRKSRLSTLSRVSSVYLINPLNYLEYLLIPAAVAVHFREASSVLSFGVGLILISAINKFGFTFGARKIAPFLNRANMLPIFDGIAGAAMLGFAISLAVSQWSGGTNIAQPPIGAQYLPRSQ